MFLTSRGVRQVVKAVCLLGKRMPVCFANTVQVKLIDDGQGVFPVWWQEIQSSVPDNLSNRMY